MDEVRMEEDWREEDWRQEDRKKGMEEGRGRGGWER